MLKANKICKLFYILCTVLFFILQDINASAQLLSANLTLPSPTTMSSGNKYYLASRSGGTSYNFDITAANPGATLQTNYDYFQIAIPTDSGNLVITWDSDGGGVITRTLGGVATTVINAAAIPSGSWDNPTVTITVTFLWTAPATINTSHNIIAAVKESGSSTIKTDTKAQSYGICSNIKIYNFSQSGDASDGYISPKHSAFNVTGTIVYDIPDYNLENSSDAIQQADITSITTQLVRTSDHSLINSFATSGNLSYPDFTTGTNIAATSINTRAAYYWRVSSVLAGTTKTSPLTTGLIANVVPSNGLALECNEAQVTLISIAGGFGRGPYLSNDYYRGYNQSGTQIQLTASMQANYGSGVAMHGDTTFNVQFTHGSNTANIPVTISSGKTTGSALLPCNNTENVDFIVDPAPITEDWTYTVTTITGGSYELAQTDDGNATGPTPAIIYWDRNDPPSSDGQTLILVQNENPSTTSITFYWEPVNTSTGSTTFDGDFYEYKIYFREQGSGQDYKVWKGDPSPAGDPTLRSVANNPWPAPVSSSLLHFNSNGWKYTTIEGLKLFTSYEYYITAIDIFGNECSATATALRTQPFSISVALTDGITHYENASFTDLSPSERPLKPANIKVTLTIISSDEPPESVKVWYAAVNTEPQNIVTPTNSINHFAGLFSANAKSSSPNEWFAYLPTTTSPIQEGSEVRFIVETTINNVSAFSDSDINTLPVKDPNDEEWTFSITKTANFQPWPVRILNNVITDEHPLAYPSYYLTDDAYITIKVYDIKGRPVATILNNAFRKGGQNIKEDGWRGTNKARKKLGAGLYYMNFNAKRVSDGKEILNETEKVVVAK